MKEWIGKKVKMVFNTDGEISYYTALIDSIDTNFITFTDKFGGKISKRLIDMAKIEELKQ